jgi:regulator of protease activity HflC (stomatin/prohibitin superfamily)
MSSNEIFYLGILSLIIFFGVMWWLAPRRVLVFEYERALLYTDGKFQRILQPGKHWLFRRGHLVQKIDVRTRFVNIPGQDVLSSDNVGIKVSIAASYKIDDPYKSVNHTANYLESLYLTLQLQLRDLVGALPIDELLTNRKQIGEALFESSKEKAAELGLALLSADIKDIMFPGELKNIYAQVVNARNEGLAALERARGETAALRNLANAAKLLEDNPAMFQLRMLQAIESKSGNTIILSTTPGDTGLLSLPRKK